MIGVNKQLRRQSELSFVGCFHDRYWPQELSDLILRKRNLNVFLTIQTFYYQIIRNYVGNW